MQLNDAWQQRRHSLFAATQTRWRESPPGHTGDTSNTGTRLLKRPDRASGSGSDSCPERPARQDGETLPSAEMATRERLRGCGCRLQEPILCGPLREKDMIHDREFQKVLTGSGSPFPPGAMRSGFPHPGKWRESLSRIPPITREAPGPLCATQASRSRSLPPGLQG